MHDVKGYMPSLGGIETPGSFGLTRAPSMIGQECVQTANDIVCASARVEMVHGPTQTGDVGGEPNEMHGTISGTAPTSRDVTCEVRSVFCERPKLARLRDREPALKRSAPGTRPRGQLKWRRIELFEFGKHGFPRGHACEARCAARRERGLRDVRSGFPGRHGRARLNGNRAVHVRVTSSVGIARHEGWVSNARCLAWGIPRKRAVNAINGATLWLHVSAERRGRACCKPPPWRRKAR